MNSIKDWKKQIKLIAQSGAYITDIERQELSAALLYRDLAEGNIDDDFYEPFFTYSILQKLALSIFNENTEDKFDLMEMLKFKLMERYHEEIDDILKEEEEEFHEACISKNPNDEFDPNNIIE